MAITLRLTDDESDALRRRAAIEGRSMQEVAREAVRRYLEKDGKHDSLSRVLEDQLPRYAEALDRLSDREKRPRKPGDGTSA